jgi:hypothetical protein
MHQRTAKDAKKSGTDFQLVTGCSLTVLWLKPKNSQRTTKEYTTKEYTENK